MAYLGQGPFQEFTNPPTKDSFTGDGSTVAFDLDQEVPSGSQNALEVYVDNVRQEPGTGKAFTLGVDGSGDTKRITFSAAPANNASIYVINDKTNSTIVAPLQNDLNGTELILDVDGDTSITADTDDRIDFKIANVEHFSFSNSSGDTIVKPMVDAKDIKFQQYDGRTLLDINDGGFIGIANGATGSGELRIYEDTDNGTNYSGFKVGAQSADIDYVLPTADGSSGTRLTTNGSGTLSWADPTQIDDNLLELNSGASSNANDSGIIIERGSTGDNAIMFWDESADEFVVGTTTATASSTGNISHTKADFEAATIRGTSGDFINTGIGDVMTVTGTGDTAAEGPDLVIKRNSASPADDDILGALVFKGENDADQAVTYGKIRARILDVTDGEEDGQLEFMAETAGSITSLAKLDSTTLYLSTGLTLSFEGATANAHETTLAVVDPTADRTISLPNVSGTLPVLAAVSATQITSTPEEINLIDGGTARGTTAIASGDGILINDGGTMRMTNVDTVRTYMEADSLQKAGGTMTGDLILGDNVKLNVDADAPTAAQAGTNFLNCLKHTCTTTDTSTAATIRYYTKYQLEGTEIAHAGFGQAGVRYMTLSFWHKHTKTGVNSFGVVNNNSDRQYVAEYTQTTSDTWEKATHTFPVDTTGTWPTDTGKAINLYFATHIGSNYQGTANTWGTGQAYGTANQVNNYDSTSNSMRFTGVQLELGSTATDFEHRSYGEELALCQRYYYLHSDTAGELVGGAGGFARANNQVRTALVFPVTMRSSPSLSAGSGTNYYKFENGSGTIYATTLGITNTNNKATEITASVSGATMGDARTFALASSSAYVTFDSEI